MSTRLRPIFTALTLGVCLLLNPKPAKAASIPTKGDIVAIGVAVAVIGAAIGIGIYLVIRHHPSIRGCAVSGSTGDLTLHSEADNTRFELTGATADIKPGERVKLSGKKTKKGAGGASGFMVEKISKDYGSCKVVPANP